FSSDGEALASAGGKGVKLWDAGTHKELTTLKSGSAASITFSSGGRRLAWAMGGSVELWDLEARRELASLNSYAGSVESVAFSPDGRTLASTSQDQNDFTVKLWDTSSLAAVSTLEHAESVNSVAFSPDSRTLASASDDRARNGQGLKLWDTITGRELVTLKG